LKQKKKILDKARGLFWKQGYDQTSMKDIARACGFEPGNIYNYFNSKEILLYEVMRNETDELLTTLKEIESDENMTPIERLRKLIEKHYELLLSYRTLSGSIFDVEGKHLSAAHRKKMIELRDRYQEIVYKIVSAGIERGDFSVDDAKLATYAIISIILRSRVWYSPKGRLSVNEIANFTFNFVLSGLGVKVNQTSVQG